MLACPACGFSLRKEGKKLICSNSRCGEKYNIVEGIPVILPHQENNQESSSKLTRSKWEKAYKEYGDEYYALDNVPKAIQLCRSYINKYINPSARTFIEVGCGTARSSLDAALNHKNLMVICLDYSLNSLMIARKLFEKNNASGFFVCGDIRCLPFKEGVFDFMFSDGVIEHFRQSKETQEVINEFYRVLRNNGRILATVPYISISILTHGQLHGNTPNIPVVKPIFEFIHVKLLNSRFMKNGYELSFTQSQLKNLFNEFSEVEVGPFHAFQEMKWLKIKLLRKIIRAMLKHKPFWYMIYGFGIKSNVKNRDFNKSLLI